MTEPWTNIPTSVLTEAEREATAKAWADQQRALAAKTFADAARAQAYQSIRTYTSQYPGQLEQPVDRGPVLDWSTVQGSSGQPVEATQDGQQPPNQGNQDNQTTQAGIGDTGANGVDFQGQTGMGASVGGSWAPGAGEGASVGGRWGRPASSGLRQTVQEATAPAFDVLNRVGVAAQDVVGAVPSLVQGVLPSGRDVVNTLQEQGRTNVGNVELMQTFRNELTPAQRERQAGLGLDVAMGVSGGGPEVVGGAAKMAPGLIEKGAQAVKRFFHGTGSAFDTPNPAKFDPNGLFGPGYYLTSDARVAGSYAETRAMPPGWVPGRSMPNPASEAFMAAQAAGPNIRAVDVPEGLNLLDADAPAPVSLVEDLASKYDVGGGLDLAHQALIARAREGRISGEQLYRALKDAAPDLKTAGDVNRLLATHGYDGIQHTGGKRVPIKDDAGQNIEHDVAVIFPEALPKIRNAISGAAGGIVSRNPLAGQSTRALALRAGAGALAGQIGTDENTPPGERITRAALGATAGLNLGGTGISRRLGAVEGAAGKAAGEVERLRLDKFPEPVRDVIQGAAEAGDDFWRTQRRGVIPDAQAEQMADQMGRTVDQMIAGGKAGKAYNTEGTRALRNGLVAQAVKVADLAEQVKAAPTDGRLVAEQLAEGMRLADLSRVAEGARAEAGRTLRAYQAFARDYAADPVSAVQRIYKANNLTAEQAVMKVNEFTKMTAAGANPFQMARFWANIEKPPPNAGDWFRALRYNAMLSGPRTSLVNIVGNAAEVPWRLTRDVAASAATGDLRPLRPEVQGIYAGVVKGLTGARQILAHGITAEQAAAGDLPRSLSARLEGRAPRAAALALELPGRGMQAADEVFKQVAFGMGKGRAAGIQASKEGLTGQAWLKRVDELVANPDKATVEGALALADRATFHGEMGYLGEKILRPAQEWSPLGVPLGNIVVPFLRTVYHITSRGVDRSPLGAVGTLVDVAKGTYGPRTAANLRSQLGRMDTKALPPGVVPLGERVGDNLMGAVAFAGLSLYAAQGNITGKGPEDVQKRRTMEAQGWQPYSIRVGDKWVSYTNWGPMAVPLSFAAALHEGQGQGADWAYDVFTRGAKVLTEQSYLQGIGNIFKVLDQQSGPTYGEKLLEGTLATIVPYGAAINTAGQATDPTLRAPEKGDVGAALQARFPGARESVPAKQDVLGRDVPNPQQGLAALSPVKANPIGNDSVVQALLDAGVDIPEPPKEISEGTVKNIPLTQAEQREYRKTAGDGISREVAAVLKHPAWASASPADRADEIKAIVEDARQAARDAVLERIGADEAKRRVAATAATPAR